MLTLHQIVVGHGVMITLCIKRTRNIKCLPNFIMCNLHSRQVIALHHIGGRLLQRICGF